MKYLLLLGVLLPATLLAQTWEIGPRVGFVAPEVTTGGAYFEVHGFGVNLDDRDWIRTSLGLTLRHTPLRARRLAWQLDVAYFRGLYTEAYLIQNPFMGGLAVGYVGWRNYRALNVPLTLQWQPARGLRLGAGLGANVHFYSPVAPVQGRGYDTLRAFSAQLQASYRRVVPFYTLSVGYDIQRFSLDLGWQRSLGSVHESFVYEGLRYPPRRQWGMWTLGAAYRLPLTKPQDVPPTEKTLPYELPPAPDYRHALRLEGGVGVGYLTGAFASGEYRRQWQNRWALGVGLNYLLFPGDGDREQAISLSERAWMAGGEVTGYYKVGDVRRLHGEVGLGTYARQVSWTYWTGPVTNTGVIGPNSTITLREPDVGATLSLGVASGLPSYGRSWQDRVSTSLRYTFQYGTYAEPLHGVRLGVGYHL